jgi:DNA-binding transcriptional ArsR family regulator
MAACRELVAGRGRKAPVTVRVVHHLLGGWPRPFALLDTRGGAPVSVERLADALAPELCALEERLPPGRWAVLACLLESTRPLGVGEIAERLYGVSSQNASSQLAILRREGLVSVLRVGRESLYEPAHATHWLAATRRAAPGRLAQLALSLAAWYRTGDTPPPGGLDLAERAGVEVETVAALRRAAAAGVDTAARLRFARADRAERRLLLGCLEGLDAPTLLGEPDAG